MKKSTIPALIAASLLAAACAGGAGADNKAQPKPRPTVTKTVTPTPQPQPTKTITKWRTRTVTKYRDRTPHACIVALDKANEALTIVSKYAGISRQYVELIQPAAQAGAAGDAAKIYQIAAKMKQLNAQVQALNDQIRTLTPAKKQAEAQCRASAA